MKKCWIKGAVAGVVVLSVFLASYAGMGILTQRAIEKTVQDLQATKGIELKVEQYHRGFFYSHALLNWKMHASIGVSKPGEVTKTVFEEWVPIQLSIAHGPLIVSKKGLHLGLGFAQGQVRLPQAYHAQFQALFGPTSVEPMMQLSVLISFLNKASIHAQVPHFHLDAKEGDTHLDWLGLSSKINLSLNLSEVDGGFKLEGFHFVKDQSEFVLGKVRSEYEFEQDALGLYTGHADLTLASLKFLTQGRPTLALEKVAFKTQSAVKSGLFDSELTASLGTLVSEGQTYGPGEVEFSLNHLDAEVLARINQQIKKMQQSPALEKQKTWFSLLPELPHLLAKGASFAIPKLSFKMPEGLVLGNVVLTMPSGDVTNPFQLIYQLNGSGSLKVPASVLKTVVANAFRQKLQVPPVAGQEAAGEALDTVQALADKRLAALVSSGALILQGDEYALSLTLEGGKISVNGKPFTPSMLAY